VTRTVRLYCRRADGLPRLQVEEVVDPQGWARDDPARELRAMIGDVAVTVNGATTAVPAESAVEHVVLDGTNAIIVYRLTEAAPFARVTINPGLPRFLNNALIAEAQLPSADWLEMALTNCIA
jgi:hypothetical protein